MKKLKKEPIREISGHVREPSVTDDKGSAFGRKM